MFVGVDASIYNSVEEIVHNLAQSLCKEEEEEKSLRNKVFPALDYNNRKRCLKTSLKNIGNSFPCSYTNKLVVQKRSH